MVYGRKDYDASQVPAEWHAWLHYITDDPPTSGKYTRYFYEAPHTENTTGTPQRYVPYSTTVRKVDSFVPKIQLLKEIKATPKIPM